MLLGGIFHIPHGINAMHKSPSDSSLSELRDRQPEQDVPNLLPTAISFFVHHAGETEGLLNGATIALNKKHFHEVTHDEHKTIEIRISAVELKPTLEALLTQNKDEVFDQASPIIPKSINELLTDHNNIIFHAGHTKGFDEGAERQSETKMPYRIRFGSHYFRKSGEGDCWHFVTLKSRHYQNISDEDINKNARGRKEIRFDDEEIEAFLEALREEGNLVIKPKSDELARHPDVVRRPYRLSIFEPGVRLMSITLKQEDFGVIDEDEQDKDAHGQEEVQLEVDELTPLFVELRKRGWSIENNAERAFRTHFDNGKKAGITEGRKLAAQEQSTFAKHPKKWMAFTLGTGILGCAVAMRYFDNKH